MSLAHIVFRRVTQPLGDRRWDLFIRATGVVALLAIPVAIAFPRLIPLLWLLILSLPANSPLSPVLPTMFEPIIMEAAKYERPIWVTVVAAVGYMYMEYLNWHAYSWVLDRRRLAAFREHRWTHRAVGYFSRRPFWTVVLFAFTPLPFWVARILAILHAYPLGRFMTATIVGRGPRWFLYAWFGSAFRIPTLLLVAIMVGGSLAAITPRLIRRQPLLPDPMVSPRTSDAAAGSQTQRQEGQQGQAAEVQQPSGAGEHQVEAATLRRSGT
jgi:membrane protein YqaA with SNARE-associated domain